MHCGQDRFFAGATTPVLADVRTHNLQKYFSRVLAVIRVYI